MQYDEYGEIIRPEEYTIAESYMPVVPTNAPTTGHSVDAMDDSVDAGVSAPSEVPTKCIASVTKLEVLCEVSVHAFNRECIDNAGDVH